MEEINKKNVLDKYGEIAENILMVEMKYKQMKQQDKEYLNSNIVFKKEKKAENINNLPIVKEKENFLLKIFNRIKHLLSELRKKK